MSNFEPGVPEPGELRFDSPATGRLTRVAATHGAAARLSRVDRRDLRFACQHLEHPSLAARLTSVVGTPIEIGLRLLPKHWYQRLHAAAEAVIAKALDAAVSSLRHDTEAFASDRFHKVLGMSTGAVGGFFGLPGLLVELPITTTIMLRSIADVARSEGEPLNESEVRLACLQVFALGGRSEEDDAADTGYYGIRLALAMPLEELASSVSRHGIGHEGAPAAVALVGAIASRFGFTVSQKAAAYLVPVIGAAGGALVNMVFMQHFQDMARGHFTVRRLERRYGRDVVQAEYERLAAVLR